MKQNITLSIDSGLLKAARALAARRNTSVSAMLAEELKAKVTREREYQQARAKALALMGTLPMGGNYLTRDEVHER